MVIHCNVYESWICMTMYDREVVGANQPYCRRSSSVLAANTKLKAMMAKSEP